MPGWYVYILRCADGTLYTGVTTDPVRRLREHNAGGGLGARYTRARRPVTLAHCEEAASRADACRREMAIKRLDRDAKLALAGLNAPSATSVPPATPQYDDARR